jgi:hypothetical protein
VGSEAPGRIDVKLEVYRARTPIKPHTSAGLAIMAHSFLPGVVKATYVRDYLLNVIFNDGTQKTIDVSQWFRGPVFEPLKRKVYFKKFFVESATVAWPNGVDISPEALYDAADVNSASDETSTRRKQTRK